MDIPTNGVEAGNSARGDFSEQVHQMRRRSDNIPTSVAEID
ncbi:MAG: hypothetical protein O3C57_03015 [Verrucomicrobia bacterium]|nr:hypothetical protein [Verrucomicrobiota bacterium]